MRRETQIGILFCSVLIAAGIPSRAQAGGQEEIVVFAAASLHDAFQQIGKDFSAANPGLAVTMNYAGSQQLAEQILQGAPADIFASADMKQMTAVRSRMDTASVKVFVRNRLTIAVPDVEGRIVRSLSDLCTPGIKMVLADRTVPAGAYALEILARCESRGGFAAGFRQAVLRNVVSYEENVRSVLSKIVLDEADAGIVYVSDIGREAQRSVKAIEIPDSLNVVAEYPVGRLRDSVHGAAAERFIAFLLSARGERILVQFGFTGVTLREKGR